MNSETLSLNFAGRVAYEIRQHTWSIAGQLLRTRDGDELRADRGSLMTRYGFEPSDRFFLSSQFRASYNRPAGIERRLAPGLGVGYQVLRGEFTRLSVDAGMTPFVDPDTGEARSRNDFTFITGPNVSF